jgi:hypothetical protein
VKPAELTSIVKPAELTSKGKLFPSLKRWREVVDNDRGFKGKSEI